MAATATLPGGTIKFDCRLDSTSGSDVHREFKGTLLPDGSLAITEIHDKKTYSFLGFAICL